MEELMELKNFDIHSNCVENASYFYDKTSICLFFLGNGDIYVNKAITKSSSYCSHSSYNYSGISQGLCGENTSSTNYTPNRITVIQMK